jgi:acyl-CoA thioester hydrolase
MTVDFRRAAGIDDVVTVETRVKTVGGAHVVLAQQVMRNREVLVTAELSVVLLSAAGKPRRFPQAVREKLAARRRA